MTLKREMMFLLNIIFVCLLLCPDGYNSCSGGDKTTKAPTGTEAPEVPDGCEEGGSPGDLIHDDTMPVFTWTKTESEPYELTVAFNDGATDIVLLRKEIFPDGKTYPDILHGALKTERESLVSVTHGAPGSSHYDIVMKSSHYDKGVFEVKDGKTYIPPEDPCKTDEEIENAEGKPDTSNANRNNVGPPASFSLSMSYHYDDRFLNGPAGGDMEKAKKLIRSVASQAQPIFSDSNWKFPSSITLHEADISHVPGNFHAGRNNGNVLRFGRGNDNRKDADLYHMFSADNDGILGQAYPLTACRQDRTFRTGVSDWPTDRFRNDEAGAAEYLMQTFVHEVGHNIAGSHDPSARNRQQYRELGKYVMYPSHTGFMSEWSSNSGRQFNNLGDGTCWGNRAGGNTGGGGGCSDSDNGATDNGGYSCSQYLVQWCGFYDDNDFRSNEMCCVCKR